MPFVNVRDLPVIERLPGWFGRYFHSQNMTFAHYDFVAGSSIRCAPFRQGSHGRSGDHR
jgi:hypothetical protein